MIAKLKRLWAAAPVATAVLALALLASGFFAVRIAVFSVFWSDPARHEQTIAGWMTPGYIAHSWRVPRGVVLDALDAPRPPPVGPMSLSRLAADQDTSVEALIDATEAAIAAHRAENPVRDQGDRR